VEFVVNPEELKYENRNKSFSTDFEVRGLANWQNKDELEDYWFDRCKKSTDLCTIRDCDLFDMVNYSIGHCVGADFSMSAGIAVEFKKLFGIKNYLQGLKANVGQTVYLKNNNRYVFYLITKSLSRKKPTYSNLYESLIDLWKHCVNLNVKKLALPKIACGLDKLKWDIVKKMIDYVFADMQIEIIICALSSENEKLTFETKYSEAIENGFKKQIFV
jgi:hypothetical protein